MTYRNHADEIAHVLLEDARDKIKELEAALQDSEDRANAFATKEMRTAKKLATAREDALREAAQIAHEHGETQYSANVSNHPQYARDAQEDAQDICDAILALINKEPKP